MNFGEQSRREFVQTGAGLLAAAYVVGCTSKNSTDAKKAIPVGVQLYSVRRECEKDLPGTLSAIAEMGYDGVEFAGYYGYEASALKKLLDDNGLKCCGSHTGLDTLSEDALMSTIEFNKILGNKYLVVPWLGEEMRGSEEKWIETAKLFTALSEKLKPHGMKVGYHNHDFEFKPIDGKVPWDIFFSNTSEDVIMQIDTGNMMGGGGDPVEYLKKYPNRATTIHLKAYSATNEKAILGEGDVNWAEIFELCETTGGTEWYIIEEEKDVYPPVQCIDLCLQNYKKLRA
jgi:sugar phosphate isomerase/epimerase